MYERILDFEAQAEQMLKIIEQRLDDNNRDTATQILMLKFKSLYEQGVVSGKRYVKEGIYPFMSTEKD